MRSPIKKLISTCKLHKCAENEKMLKGLMASDILILTEKHLDERGKEYV